jgi:hypothetical protein
MAQTRSQGAYGGYSPTTTYTWSSKSNTPMPQQMEEMYRTMFPTSTSQAGGATRAMQQGIAPTPGEYQQGVIRDLAQAEYLNRANFERKEQARKDFDTQTQAAMGRVFDPKTGKYAGQDMYDLAASEQKRLEAETRANQKAMAADIQRGRQALAASEGQMNAMYGRALGEIDEGRDKISSDMAAAMRQNAQMEGAQQFGGMLGQLEGSEGQVAEAQRLFQSELERGVGANVSQIQFQGAQQKSAIRQAQASSALSMGQAKAGYEQAATQFGAQSRQATEAAIAGSSAIAQANAAFIGQQAQWLAANQMNRSSELYKMVESNPVLGVTWADAFTQMGAISQAAGMGAFGSLPPSNNQSNFSYGTYNPTTGAFSQTPSQRMLGSRDNFNMQIQHMLGSGGFSGQAGYQAPAMNYQGLHNVPLR